MGISFKDLKSEKAKLEASTEDLVRLQMIADEHPEYVLAELIHERTCHENHAGGCGWYYETWNAPGSCRMSYVEKAEKILEHSTFEVAKLIITEL